jgi:hypothetical protein
VSLVPVLAHYVSWHTVPGGWNVCPALPVRRDNPAGGYSAANPDIIVQHNTEMQANGIWPMVSWWGPNAPAGDAFMDRYLSLSGPPLAVLYEAWGSPDRLQADARGDISFTDPRNVDQFIAELKHLNAKYFNGPHGNRFVRVDGRPLVFIWISHAFTGPFEAVAAQVRDFAYLVGSEFTVPAVIKPEHHSVIRGMDAITSYGFYDPRRYPEVMNDTFVGEYTNAIRQWRLMLASVSPGTQLLLPLNFAYDERGIPNRHGWVFSSPEDVARRYARVVASYATEASPGILPMVYLTSYNEHYEGSGIEPTVDPERPDYLSIVRETFTSPVP